ncbi:hypothetical protein TNCV_4141271 [Trichonephila clavipes]|nr:hypothetical protein TNCV_4141271 [Trichonephila clavipes]
MMSSKVALTSRYCPSCASSGMERGNCCPSIHKSFTNAFTSIGSDAAHVPSSLTYRFTSAEERTWWRAETELLFFFIYLFARHFFKLFFNDDPIFKANSPKKRFP